MDCPARVWSLLIRQRCEWWGEGLKAGNVSQRDEQSLAGHLMARVDCPDKDAHLAQPDPDIVFDFAEEQIQSGRIAP